MCQNRRSFLRSSATLLGAGVLGASHGHADEPQVRHVHSASRMTECANRLLVALDANQRGKAIFPFDSDERLNWHFIPKDKRKGLQVKHMDAEQRKLAHALLSGAVSQPSI